MPSIKIDAVEFYYELHGEGYPLVLIGGYATPLWMWKSLIDQLKDTFRILVFDNQGVGRTKDNGAVLTVEGMAENITKLIDALRLSKPYIVGLSMGGNIAQRIASHHRENIEKLVLLVASAKWRQATLLGLEMGLIMREKQLDSNDIFSISIAWSMGEKFLQDKRRVEELKQKFIKDPYSQSLEDRRRQFEALKHFDGRNDLARIKVPTLVLYAIEDVTVFPYEAKFLADHIPLSTLVECPGAHRIIFENCHTVANNLKKFLST